MIVYSLVIPCFLSHRVSIDSRVWNRNADDCFFSMYAEKSGVYRDKERFVQKPNPFTHVLWTQYCIKQHGIKAKKCKYYMEIHKNECALRKLSKFHVSKAFQLRRPSTVYILSLLMCKRISLVPWSWYCSAVNRDAVRHNMLLLLHIIARSNSGMFLLMKN